MTTVQGSEVHLWIFRSTHNG